MLLTIGLTEKVKTYAEESIDVLKKITKNKRKRTKKELKWDDDNAGNNDGGTDECF